MTVCDTKVIYDTTFEAEIGAARMERKTGEDFMYYDCGNHFHISHADPSKRRGAGKGYKRCPRCKDIYSTKKKHRCRIDNNT